MSCCGRCRTGSRGTGRPSGTGQREEVGLAENQVLTYLQMISLDELRPAPVPAVPIEIIEQDRHSPLIRSTTLRIGRAHSWPSQSWSEEQWQAYLDHPYLRHWVAVLDGGPVGLLSLDVPPGGDVEIDTFGLLPDHVGRGLGAAQSESSCLPLPVDLGAMPEPDRDDHQFLIADLGDHPPVADTVAPVPGEVRGQRLAPLTWVVKFADVFEVCPDSSQHRAVNTACGLVELR